MAGLVVVGLPVCARCSESDADAMSAVFAGFARATARAAAVWEGDLEWTFRACCGGAKLIPEGGLGALANSPLLNANEVVVVAGPLVTLDARPGE